MDQFNICLLFSLNHLFLFLLVLFLEEKFDRFVPSYNPIKKGFSFGGWVFVVYIHINIYIFFILLLFL
jgi:hypothetical protein